MTSKHIRVIKKMWNADSSLIPKRQRDACVPCVMARVECKFQNIVTHMTIGRQRLAKHIPGATLSTIEHPLLGNDPINTHSL
jgi:hypothetical protein